MNISTTHRTVLATVGGAALALAAAWPAAAADLPSPKTSKDGDKTVIEVLSTFTGETFTPKGGEPGDFPDDENFIPKAGDAVTFTEDLSQDGTEVGKTVGNCTIVKVVGTELTDSCVITVTFASGTLKATESSTFDIAEEGEEGGTFTVPIVGGTGAYAGARGTAVVEETGEETSDITLSFTTTGQVAEVPAGGAATGGGVSEDAGTVALLAIGAAVIAAGAGVAGAGRLAARRR